VTHRYFDENGDPISLEHWGRRFETDRTLLADPLEGARTLRTVWLGFVDPVLLGARLFGTAIMDAGRFVAEVELYDTQEQAREGHARHLLALRGHQ
jgi:hypothetical protein